MIIETIFLTCVASFANAALLPNIILIVSDDQDAELHGMYPLRQTQHLLGAAGVTFTNAFTTSPLCCPSRASILSGMYAHNHRTYNNSISGGCNDAHWRENIELENLPVTLQNAGYTTFFAGKYLNQYYGEHLPVGWTDFHGLHGNSRYYNYTLRENSQNKSYTDTYLTDLLRDLSLEFLSKQSGPSPFFAMICPPAPHQPFTPAERHRNAFSGIKALRTPNFNQRSLSLDKHWLVASSQLMKTETIQVLDSYFQQRWETLLAVDELVASVIEHLDSLGHLQNTYIVYTSDNGYHLGQFALPYDKRQPYETDIHVPFLLRGPGVPQNLKLNIPIALIDIFPTLLDWANLPKSSQADGLSLNPYIRNTSFGSEKFHRSFLIQHWGEGNSKTYNPECPFAPKDNLAGCMLETNCHCQDAHNNTYACVRHFHDNVDRLYCEFKDEENFVEAYDLVEDPYQMVNLGYDLLPIERAFYNLALKNLTNCKGVTCNNINI